MRKDNDSQNAQMQLEVAVRNNDANAIQAALEMAWDPEMRWQDELRSADIARVTTLTWIQIFRAA